MRVSTDRGCLVLLGSPSFSRRSDPTENGWVPPATSSNPGQPSLLDPSEPLWAGAGCGLDAATADWTNAFKMGLYMLLAVASSFRVLVAGLPRQARLRPPHLMQLVYGLRSASSPAYRFGKKVDKTAALKYWSSKTTSQPTSASSEQDEAPSGGAGRLYTAGLSTSTSSSPI
ncbi:uncharacterized protein LOC135086942 [Ostrinia nubilalis]|uniref:uncharacterized protein LOC135086942 n=1 Tax=Ostrinia nubilalis TaxID=29057 RepID=UPI0030824134